MENLSLDIKILAWITTNIVTIMSICHPRLLTTLQVLYVNSYTKDCLYILYNIDLRAYVPPEHALNTCELISYWRIINNVILILILIIIFTGRGTAFSRFRVNMTTVASLFILFQYII